MLLYQSPNKLKMIDCPFNWAAGDCEDLKIFRPFNWWDFFC